MEDKETNKLLLQKLDNGEAEEAFKILQDAYDLTEFRFKEIGEFIYLFSTLEHAIKLRLADALEIPGELFDAVTAPYDFAVLCQVTKVTLTHLYPGDEGFIEKVFSECLALNNDRVRIAHGLWIRTEGGGQLAAHHVSRGGAKPKSYFSGPDDLENLIQKVRPLMVKVLGAGLPALRENVT